VRREIEHPFSPVVVAVSGALTLGASIVSVPLELHGWTLYNRYSAPTYVPSPQDRQDLDGARTGAYTAVGAAIGLGVVTAGLAAWYFLGTQTREVVVTPAGVAGRF
jgi:hypothetical protein